MVRDSLDGHLFLQQQLFLGGQEEACLHGFGGNECQLVMDC